MNDHWRIVQASEIAYAAMGTDIVRHGLDRVITHRADADPLAWWCLTEWIYNYGQRYSRQYNETLENRT